MLIMVKGHLTTLGFGELHLHDSVSLGFLGDARVLVELNNMIIV
jgi:hypothetical protein